MSGGGRTATRRARRTGRGLAALRSPAAALVAALSLVFQLLAIPYHQALVASAEAAPDPAAIVADLKATFGDAAALCVQRDDTGAPVSPAGDCADHCPLCQFAAQAAALIAPDAPALPVRLEASFRTLGAAPERGAIPIPPTKQTRARAPPFAV